jgi:hypothetical protein
MLHRFYDPLGKQALSPLTTYERDTERLRVAAADVLTMDC